MNVAAPLPTEPSSMAQQVGMDVDVEEEDWVGLMAATQLSEGGEEDEEADPGPYDDLLHHAQVHAEDQQQDESAHQELHDEVQQWHDGGPVLVEQGHPAAPADSHTTPQAPAQPACQHVQQDPVPVIHHESRLQGASTQLAFVRIPVQQWLHSLEMQHHLPCFEHHHVDELALPLLTDQDLQAMGIHCPQERSTMLISIPPLCDYRPAPELDQLLLALQALHTQALHTAASPPAPAPSLPSHHNTYSTLPSHTPATGRRDSVVIKRTRAADGCLIRTTQPKATSVVLTSRVGTPQSKENTPPQATPHHHTRTPVYPSPLLPTPIEQPSTAHHGVQGVQGVVQRSISHNQAHTYGPALGLPPAQVHTSTAQGPGCSSSCSPPQVPAAAVYCARQPPGGLPFQHMFRSGPPPTTRITSYFRSLHHTPGDDVLDGSNTSASTEGAPSSKTAQCKQLSSATTTAAAVTAAVPGGVRGQHIHHGNAHLGPAQQWQQQQQPPYQQYHHYHANQHHHHHHQQQQQHHQQQQHSTLPNNAPQPAAQPQQQQQLPTTSAGRLAPAYNTPAPPAAAAATKRRRVTGDSPALVNTAPGGAPTRPGPPPHNNGHVPPHNNVHVPPHNNVPPLRGLMLTGIPPWHTLPGTRFTVDYFNPAAAAKVQGSNGFWILTHFHADHYKGLSRTFSKGQVVCSAVTAELVSTRLKVPVAKLHVLPMNETQVVDGVPLMLIDANHCPGAAMVIAHPPGKPPVLHTGDCRLTPEMQSHPALQALRGTGTTLVLDTTYCDPQYVFPPQQDTLKYTLDAVRAEMFNPRALFVFGTYTIGKERLFLEVAHTLQKKVYVNKDKMQVLQCCALAPSYLSLLTTNHLETNFHAVPLHKVNLDGLSAILLNYKGRYNTIVGIQPTGWAMQRQSTKGSCGRRVQKGTVIMHSVPYSEHSSFKELHEFCAWLQPRCILPSVGNDNGVARDKMLALLQAPLPPSHKTPAAIAAAAAGSKPITAFLKRKTSPD